MTEDVSDNGNSIMMVRHKLVFVGDVFVGKTTVMHRFVDNVYKDEYDVFI
jgi:GTPase SAR1 family protein